METDPMSIELRLAAIISLLSSSSINGVSQGKVAAIRAHLSAAVQSPEIGDIHLKQALENVLSEMKAFECEQACPASNTCLLSSPQTLH